MRIASLTIAFALVFMSFTNAQSGLQEGERFLKENATKPGVNTTSSGLQYKVLQEGTGKSPKATDVVVVNYRGTLINGKEFDSSYKAGKPIEFSIVGRGEHDTQGLHARLRQVSVTHRRVDRRRIERVVISTDDRCP